VLKILEDLRGDPVVSCQAADGSPLHSTEHIVALARAAVLGGAKAVRIEACTMSPQLAAQSTFR